MITVQLGEIFNVTLPEFCMYYMESMHINPYVFRDVPAMKFGYGA
jgi:hypothetical protein